MEEEKIKTINMYVQKSAEVEGKWEVIGLMWSNWAGNFWKLIELFDTKEEAITFKQMG